jgi:hypothetical protein
MKQKNQSRMDGVDIQATLDTRHTDKIRRLVESGILLVFFTADKIKNGKYYIVRSQLSNAVLLSNMLLYVSRTNQEWTV